MDKQQDSLKVIIGLGNIGSEYSLTRHNIGFEIVDALGKALDMEPFHKSKELKAHVAVQDKGDIKTMLVKPATYMNRSGVAVKSIIKKYGIHLSDLLIIYDDIDLPFGKLRIKASGSAGTHNGVKDIQHACQSKDYPRLRIGIGESNRQDLSDYVLEKFSQDELEQLPLIIEKASFLSQVWLNEGLSHAIARQAECNAKLVKELNNTE